GQTMGCTRCHDHKFDPIAQKEFYGVFAYFNNVPENGRALKYGNSPPVLQSPTRQQQAELAALDARLAAAEKRFDGMQKDLPAAQASWEKSLSSATQWTLERNLVAHFSLDGGAGQFDGKR